MVSCNRDIDLDGDGDGTDLTILLGAWGVCPEVSRRAIT